jgi:hypothetical protein
MAAYPYAGKVVRKLFPLKGENINTELSVAAERDREFAYTNGRQVGWDPGIKMVQCMDCGAFARNRKLLEHH